ncbi:MAG: AI-2E family transporter [Desulfovibrio sp.]|nr:AI-2E family transporter [Desulfovibrio sp.]
MSLCQCRIFYLLAFLACGLLLLPTPGTVFLAVCFSCLGLPLYRHLKYLGLKKYRKLPKAQSFRRSLYRRSPLLLYTLSLLMSVFIPLAVLLLLVAPQASRGLTQLRSMEFAEKVKVLMPENLKNFVNSHLPSLNDYPALKNILGDLTDNISEHFFSFLGNIFTPSVLWQRAVGFLGGSLTVLWTLFLFFTLTILFTLYARQARTIVTRILQLPLGVIRRFVSTIYKALSAVMLGVVLVALIQGLFCGIGFAVAGIESAAFWGLMAAFVAPIPMIGTMLVWGPLALLLWFKGSHFAAIGLMLWGAIAVSGIDNICRPIFLQQGIKAPIFVLILVMICGMSVFGPLGVIAGPVLLACSLQLIEEAHTYFPSSKKQDSD